MKWVRKRRTAVAILLLGVGCCEIVKADIGTKVQEESPLFDEREAVLLLREKIMCSWAEINRARIISPRYAQHFQSRIIHACLDLYQTLCDTVMHIQLLPHELKATFDLLEGLWASHDALCNEYQPTLSFGSYYLMLAIMKVWCFVEKKTLTIDEAQQCVTLKLKE
jgi:hypothetical protein